MGVGIEDAGGFGRDPDYFGINLATRVAGVDRRSLITLRLSATKNKVHVGAVGPGVTKLDREALGSARALKVLIEIVRAGKLLVCRVVP